MMARFTDLHQFSNPFPFRTKAHEKTMSHPRRIVLTTIGSLGDLHPYIALALGLKARGHDPVIATAEGYRSRIEPLGIGFAPVRPDEPDWASDPTLMARIMDLRRGGEVVIRE